MNSTEFINDKSKIELQAGDLFDKVINLKFNCTNKDGNKESFVIRSDYEIVYTNANFASDRVSDMTKGGWIIRKCTYKPSIKVRLKMVTANTGTDIGITVSNFFMLTKDGKHLRSFNASDYKIDSLEIVMGYWGQLKNSLNPDSATAMDDYFSIEATNGADKITVTTITVVTTEKLPPDSALHIKGYVGNIYSSPVAVTNVDTPTKALEKPVASSGTEFEQILFENITRRYVNIASLQEYVKTHKEFKKVQLDSENKLSDTDAKNIGIKVYLSDEAKKVSIKKIKDSKDEEEVRKVYFEMGWTVGRTVARIMSYMDKELDYTFSNEGDILIYTPNELQAPEGLTKAFHSQNLYKNTVLANSKLYNGRLPAVYNINIDAVATIVCPFFTFIQPFQYVEFASRYALTSVVTYFASYKPTIYRFLVISATISFATVDDVNEVQITAVSARDSYAQV
jgi:hypothetical protein